MNKDPLIGTVMRLLDNARPGGIAHRRLVKYRDQLERNVMLGPSVLKYIRDLVTKLDVEVECKHLSEFGVCRLRKQRCNHVDNNRECNLYEANRPITKGNPLGG